MAVIGVKEKTSLKLELDGGIVDGRQRIQNKSFNKIKTEALDESIYETGLAIADLQSRDLLRVKKIEETRLSED